MVSHHRFDGDGGYWRRRPRGQPFIGNVDSDLHVIAHPSAFPTTFQRRGYLDVRTGFVTGKQKPWKRRYFLINNNFLLAAPTSHSTKLEKVIPLEGAKVIAIDGSSDLSFKLFIRKHTLYFRAASATQCIEWINSIQKASTLRIKDIYRFRYTLGGSKMRTGTVVSATHRTSDAHSAIKIVDKRKFDKEKLRTEIQILRKIDSKYVATLYDLFETKKYLYIVMQKCVGGTLFKQLGSRDHSVPIDENWCCKIVHQIVSGVQHLHKLGLILNHFKPDNILCVYDNIYRIKIADFGFSNFLTETNNITADQIAYMAPELLKSNQRFSIGNVPQQFLHILHHFYKNLPMDIIKLLARFYYNIDAAADSWSIGVIMFVLLVGYKPFSGEDSKAISKSILHDNTNDVFNCKHWDHVSSETLSLLKGLLTKNPFERKPCGEVLKLKWEVTINSFAFNNW